MHVWETPFGVPGVGGRGITPRVGAKSPIEVNGLQYSEYT